jgi:hypothetical protein
MIDELDRCKPTYAVSSLERLKHLFSVPGVVFVLALDSEQLGHSIRAVYGSGMDAEGYLRRFIDYEFELPLSHPGDFAHYLMNHFGLFDVIRNDQVFVDVVNLMIQIFGFSLRKQEQYFTELNMITRSYGVGLQEYIYILPFLIALKMSDKLRYHELSTEHLNIDNFFKPFDDYIGGRSNPESALHIKSLFDSWLSMFYLRPSECQERYSEAVSLVEKADKTNPGFYYADLYLRMIQAIKNRNYEGINYIKRMKTHIDTLRPNL